MNYESYVFFVWYHNKKVNNGCCKKICLNPIFFDWNKKSWKEKIVISKKNRFSLCFSFIPSNNVKERKEGKIMAELIKKKKNGHIYMSLFFFFSLIELSLKLIFSSQLTFPQRKTNFPIRLKNWWKKTYFPTKFSSTELFPADCPPTTAIWGKSSCIWTPSCVKASWSLFTIGIRFSIPKLPDILATYMLP